MALSEAYDLLVPTGTDGVIFPCLYLYLALQRDISLDDWTCPADVHRRSAIGTSSEDVCWHSLKCREDHRVLRFARETHASIQTPDHGRSRDVEEVSRPETSTGAAR